MRAAGPPRTTQVIGVELNVWDVAFISGVTVATALWLDWWGFPTTPPTVGLWSVLVLRVCAEFY